MTAPIFVFYLSIYGNRKKCFNTWQVAGLIGEIVGQSSIAGYC